MGEGFVRAGKEDLLRRRVDQIDFAVGIDGNDALLQGVKHGLTLLKLGGNLLRLQPQQDALQTAYQAPGAQRADQRAEQDCQEYVPAAVGDLFVHFTQRNADHHHANLLALVVEHRGEYPQRRGQHAVVNGNVLFSLQRGQDIPADKPLTDDRGIRMRIANTVHIGDDSVQQVVAPGDGLRQRLNDLLLRGRLQSALHLRHISHGARHRQRGLFQTVAGGIADLHIPQGIDQQENGADDAANHQGYGGAQL